MGKLNVVCGGPDPPPPCLLEPKTSPMAGGLVIGLVGGGGPLFVRVTLEEIARKWGWRVLHFIA